MRIYRRPEFLKLPAGTMFHSGEPWFFGTLRMKGCNPGDCWHNDYLALDLGWVKSTDSGQAEERLTAMLEKDASFPMDTSFGRDGSFEDDELYLVYERADLEVLQRFVQNAMEAA